MEIIGQDAAVEIDISLCIVEVLEHFTTQEGTQKVVGVMAALVSSVESLAIAA